MTRKSAKGDILEGAIKIFSEKGYHASSLQEIAKVSGTTKSNIMYHFSSKEGLFQEVIKLWDKEFEDIWHDIYMKDCTSSEKIELFTERTIRSDLGNPLRKSYFEYIGTITDDPISYKEKLNEGLDWYKGVNKRLLQDGIDSGEFKKVDVELYADMLHGCLNGLTESFNNYDIEKITEITLAFVKMFLQSISVDK